MERFLGNLIEHYKGAFPGWLSPMQVIVLPIVDELHPLAQDLQKQLRAMAIRSEVDYRNEKIGYKIREAEARKIPVMLVVGKKEAAAGTVSVRERGRKDLGSMTIEAALDYIKTVTTIPRSTID